MDTWEQVVVGCCHETDRFALKWVGYARAEQGGMQHCERNVGVRRPYKSAYGYLKGARKPCQTRFTASNAKSHGEGDSKCNIT